MILKKVRPLELGLRGRDLRRAALVEDTKCEVQAQIKCVHGSGGW